MFSGTTKAKTKAINKAYLCKSRAGCLLISQLNLCRIKYTVQTKDQGRGINVDVFPLPQIALNAIKVDMHAKLLEVSLDQH